MPYLLDTNVWVAYLRGRSPPVQQRMMAAGSDSILLTSIVKAELLYGAHKSADPPKNLLLLADVFSTFRSIPFTDAAAEVYATIRLATERAGKPIGASDLLIAASALADGLVLVTHNMSEFSRVPGLTIEGWEAIAPP